jgi:hypothetical protein
MCVLSEIPIAAYIETFLARCYWRAAETLTTQHTVTYVFVRMPKAYQHNLLLHR